MNGKAAIAVILATAVEVEPNFIIESHAYLAIGGDMALWERVRNVLVGSGLMTISPRHTLHLTPKGRELGVECKKLIEAVQKEKVHNVMHMATQTLPGTAPQAPANASPVDRAFREKPAGGVVAETTVPYDNKRMQSKFKSTCVTCGKTIEKGEEIIYRKGLGAKHYSCFAQEPLPNAGSEQCHTSAEDYACSDLGYEDACAAACGH